MIGLEINDAGIRASSSRGPIALDQGQPESPAYFYYDGSNLVCGNQAMALNRIHPRKTFNLAWERLSLEPASLIDLEKFTYAELCYAQLKSMADSLRDHELIVTVPGIMNTQQLGIILGMMQELDLKVRKMSDSALIGMANKLDVAEALVVDIHLHKAIVSQLKAEENIYVSQSDTLPAAGWADLIKLTHREIAAAFVAETRFDPLHSAHSDQALFDQIVTALNQENPQESYRFVAEHEGRSFNIDYPLSELEKSCENWVSSIGLKLEAHTDKKWYISDRARRVPGLLKTLKELGSNYELQAPGIAAANAARFGEHFESSDGEEVGMAREIPLRFDEG